MIRLISSGSGRNQKGSGKDQRDTARRDFGGGHGREKITALETVISEICSVSAVCGPDSSEYEMIGGTRASDRKKRKKKSGETD